MKKHYCLEVIFRPVGAKKIKNEVENTLTDTRPLSGKFHFFQPISKLTLFSGEVVRNKII